MDIERVKERLYSHTVLSDDESCWTWLGAHARGYGNIKVDGKTQRTTRVSYMVHIGAIPEGQHVLHHCDNPSCVNPYHLFLGTQKDNIKDMKQKGRCAHGERHGQSKLTDNQVQAIHEQKTDGESVRDIAASLGVHKSTISRILNGQQWAHIYPHHDKEN